MGNSLLLIALLVFSSVLLLIVSIASFVRSSMQRRKLVGRINEVSPGNIGTSTSGTVERGARTKNRIINMMAAVGRKVKPESSAAVSHVRLSFQRAGYHHRSAPVIYYGAKTVLAALLPAALIVLKVALAKPIALTMLTVLCVSTALLGFYLPTLWLQARIGARRDKILEGFPDALDLMVVCVEAGMGIDAVVQRVGNEMKMQNRIVSQEFQYLSLELRAGKRRADALRNLALRANLEDVSSLVTLLIQTDKFGTSVAQALRVHSSSMRTKRQQRAEEMAAKLPVKLVFPLICFIFPALFVVIAGPAVIKIVRAFSPFV